MLNKIKLLTIFFIFISPLSFSHGGGLNKYGCHNDNINGGYHCHRGSVSNYQPKPKTYSKNLSEKDAVCKTQKLLFKKNKEKVDSMVSKGKQALLTGKDVIIVCKYGKHRSKAIAQLLGTFLPQRIFFDHRE